MYAQARAGTIRNFTGIDDPYEAPLAPELTLDTTAKSVDENAERIVGALEEKGFVRG
jgi:adenylylsulfate kinase-like enzyme